MFVVFHQNILGIYALGCEPPPSESVEGKIKIVISEQKKKVVTATGRGEPPKIC